MWRYWMIEGEAFYAPTLDLAFDAARATMPLRRQWTCTGSRS